MKILLLAPDSKLPNLALMKLSAYHKGKGDETSTKMSDPDIIYISILFEENKYIARAAKFLHPSAKILVGGPGYDPTVLLPPEVEEQPPDHSIYECNGYSYGRITSGCPRKCHFCIVHVQEPNGVRYIQHPSKIWVPGSILRIFDDNLLACPDAWNELYEWAIEKQVKLHIEYLDIRLVTPDIARQMKGLKHDNSVIWFSFDFKNYERELRAGVQNLVDAGFSPSALHFNIYCNDEKSLASAKYRWGVVVELGCEPFLMVPKENRTPRLNKLIRRCNRPAIRRGANLDKLFDLHTKNQDDLRNGGF